MEPALLPLRALASRIPTRPIHERTFGKQSETALALNRFEKEIDGNIRFAAVPVALEEVAAGARVAHAAENTGSKEVLVGNPTTKEAGF
jgi:hypothetical protein